MTDWLLKRTTGSGILMLNAEVLRSQRLTADLKCVLRLYVDDRWWCQHQEHFLNVSLDFRGTLLKFTFLLSEVVSCRSDVDWHKRAASFCVFVYLCAFSVFLFLCIWEFLWYYMFSVFKSVFVHFCCVLCVFLYIFLAFLVCFGVFLMCVFIFLCVFFCELVGKQISTYTWTEDESRPRTQTTSSSGADPDKGTFPRIFSLTFFYNTWRSFCYVHSFLTE